MIPEILFSSYQRYKEDTNVFTTWLSQAARACGFKSEDIKRKGPETPKDTEVEKVAPRLKGKARKQAKEATSSNDAAGQNGESRPVPVSSFLLTTKKLIEQAEMVANFKKAKIKMPDNILHLARRAINARQRCSNWFRETRSKDEASTEGHAHFIAVLEKALKILEPCYSSDSSENGKKLRPEKKLTTSTKSGPQTFDDDLSNRFGLLQVEDIDDDVELTATEIKVPVKSVPAKPKSQAEREIWELVDEFSTDIAFVVFCFFEDLHRIQDFLKQTWREYKDGELDLMTCTMTTNLALDLVRRAEEDIIGQAPKLLAKPRSYEAISMLIFFAESFARGKSPNEALASDESLKITPFDEFIYLSTARILIKFEQIAALKIAYPQPVPSVKLSYLSRPDLLDLPQVKKWEEDDEFLSQLLMEMMLNDDISKAMAELSWKRTGPKEDELTKGFYQLRREGEVSTWIVFAARVLLDIRDIMGKDMSRSHKEQVAAGFAADKTLNMTVVDGALTPTGERWKARDGEHLMNLWSLLQYYTIKDPFPLMKQKWLAEKAHVVNQYTPVNELPPEMLAEARRHYQSQGRDVQFELPPQLAGGLQKVGLRPIKHAGDPNFLRTQNPLASGTQMFQICLAMEHAGTTLANHHQAIFAVSHLYNAMRQTKLLEATWPEMEELIERQILELFSGQLPETPKDFHHRFALRLGFSAQQFAKNKRTHNRKQLYNHAHKDGPQMSDTPTSQILQEYIQNKEPMARCLYRLETTIQDSARESKKVDKRLAKRQLTPLEALGQIREWLPTVLPIMKLDYIKLTRTCNRLLKLMHARIGSELEIEHTLIQDGDSQEYGYCIMALSILKEVGDAKFIQEDILKCRGSDVIEGSPQLEVCADVMKAHLVWESINS